MFCTVMGRWILAVGAGLGLNSFFHERLDETRYTVIVCVLYRPILNNYNKSSCVLTVNCNQFRRHASFSL